MGTTAQKLTYLNETKTQLKDTINYSGASITDDTFRQYPRKLYTQYLDILKNPDTLFDGMPKVPEQTGTELTLDGTANTPMQLELKPSELTQETTTGKNKINCPDTTVNATGSDYFLIDTSSLDNTKNYTLSFDYDPNNATFSSSGNLIVSLIDSAGSGLVATTSSKGRYHKSFNGATRLRLYVTSRLSTGSIIIKNVMLEESSTETSFEPYTGGIPAPNPDYPSDVQVIKGNNSIKIESKNLLNPNNLVVASPFVSMSSENILTIEPNSTGYFKTAFDDLKLPSGTYTFYCEILSGNYTGGNLCFFDLNNTQVSGEFNFKLTTTYPNHTYTKTFDNGLNQLKFYQPYCTSEVKIKLWIVKGTHSIMPEFIKHQEQVLSLNLPNGMEYCKIGDYEDEFEHDGDKWYLNKYIGKVDLSTIEWRNYDPNKYYSLTQSLNESIVTTGMYVSNPALCEKYISKSFASNLQNGQFAVGQVGETARVYAYDSTGTPTGNMYYQLSTPTHTEITDTTLISELNAIEQAVSYDEQTNISQTNAQLPFRIKASAIKRLESIFE